MSNTAVVYSREQYDRILQAERIINDLLPVIDKLEACGEDCNNYRFASKQFFDKLALIKANFFSPPPT